MIPGNANPLLLASAAADAVAAAGPIKSVRFNSGDSAYLNRTPSSTGNRRTWTWSSWVKLCKDDTNNRTLFSTGTASSSSTMLRVMSSGYLNLSHTGTGIGRTDMRFRDTSAWYHIVCAFDSTQSVQADRIKIYVNGVLQSLSVSSCSLNLDSFLNHSGTAYKIGAIHDNDSNYFLDGYLADTYLIDGSALDATSFGAFDDNGVWQAAAYSGTFGTNGFHLFDFANESTVGNDSSGNDNDFTVNNITNVEANNTDGIDNISNITQLNLSGSTVTTNLANLRLIMNTSVFQDADTDHTTHAIKVGGTVKKFAIKWSSLTGLTGISVRWQRVSTYDADVRTSGTGITTSTVTLTSSRRQDTFSTTSTSGTILFEDVTSGDTNGFTLRCIEFKGYGTVTYPTNVENFTFPDADQDVLFDVPTNGTQSDTGAGGEVSGNYATLNPLNIFGSASMSNGNLDGTCTASSQGLYGTIAMSSGKWYWEILQNSAGGMHGIANLAYSDNNWYDGTGGYFYYYTGPKYSNSNTSASYGDSYTTGDVVGVAYDADNGNLYFYKNGVAQNSGTAAFTGLSGTFAPFFQDGLGSTHTFSVNFGARSFAYSAPSGYKPLCTTLLPTPTIADGSDYFDVALDTGANILSSTKALCGGNADFLWIKDRANASTGHHLIDIVRDPNLDGTPFLACNSTSDETTLGTYSAPSGSSVGWAWDAGSSTASNTDGDITSSVRANQTAGFSIVSYTGNGTAGETIGHGLNAAPEMIIVKNRDSALNWPVGHQGLDSSSPWTKNLYLNSSGSLSTLASIWNNTAPTNSVFTVGASSTTNNDGSDFIAYCFAPVAGYSAFGSYEGNQSTDGPFVYLGFKPAVIWLKNIDSSSHWLVYDTARDTFNIVRKNLTFSTFSETGNELDTLDIVSNGFKIRNTAVGFNSSISSQTYIYYAVAENSFQANGGLAR